MKCRNKSGKSGFSREILDGPKMEKKDQSWPKLEVF